MRLRHPEYPIRPALRHAAMRPARTKLNGPG